MYIIISIVFISSIVFVSLLCVFVIINQYRYCRWIDKKQAILTQADDLLNSITVDDPYWSEKIEKVRQLTIKASDYSDQPKTWPFRK